MKNTTTVRYKRDVIKRRVENLILRGVTNQEDMANAFGVSRQTIGTYIRDIYEKWKNENDPEVVELRILRQKQLENLLQLTLDSFHISRQPIEDYEILEVDCDECNGEGILEDLPDQWIKCEGCEGKKTKTIERKTIKGEPGNPQFIRVAKEVLVELLKVHGGYPETHHLQKRMITESVTAGGDIRTTVEEMFLEGPADTIIKARQVIDEIKTRVKDREAKLLSAKQIETEKVKKDEWDEQASG